MTHTTPGPELDADQFAIILDRVRRWHADNCPAELDTCDAYADLDASDNPLWHDIGDVLGGYDRRSEEFRLANTAVRNLKRGRDEAIADRDRAREVAVLLEQQLTEVMRIAAMATEYLDDGEYHIAAQNLYHIAAQDLRDELTAITKPRLFKAGPDA